jgi:DNA modification methylase
MPKPRANTLNDLGASEWMSESVSVWLQRGLGAGHPDAQIERLHPAPFSFSDVSRLIRLFTKEGMTVLDPFVGVGSTLKACALERRNGIGFELNRDFVRLAKLRLKQEVPADVLALTRQTVTTGDARKLVKTLPPSSVDFVVTSPPYWTILKKVDHKVQQERIANGLMQTNYGDDPRDFGNIESYDDFVNSLADLLATCALAMTRNAYMAVVVGDFRHGGRYYMLHADLAGALQGRGLVLKAANILYQNHKRVYPYGYPSAYVSNIHHQFVVVLQKDRR